jgi:uncharacterized protein YndB with AHSA1/START domain
MNAPLKITPAPVRKSIRVNVPQARAFEVFAARIDRWWPASHTLLKSPVKATIVESRIGGRWYQIGDDGSQCVNGFVRDWSPPSKLVLSWRLNAKFEIDDSVESGIEIRFIAEAPNATRVELEHRITAVDGEAMRTAVDAPNGWSAILAAYAQSAEGKSE